MVPGWHERGDFAPLEQIATKAAPSRIRQERKSQMRVESRARLASPGSPMHMEQAMRTTICALTALGVAVVVGPTVANAQTVISGEPVESVITQYVQTAQTTETIRTVRPGA